MFFLGFFFSFPTALCHFINLTRQKKEAREGTPVYSCFNVKFHSDKCNCKQIKSTRRLSQKFFTTLKRQKNITTSRSAHPFD